MDIFNIGLRKAKNEFYNKTTIYLCKIMSIPQNNLVSGLLDLKLNWNEFIVFIIMHISTKLKYKHKTIKWKNEKINNNQNKSKQNSNIKEHISYP